MADLSFDRARELFICDMEQGQLIWRERPREDFTTYPSFKSWNAVRPGTVAGCIVPNGYINITFQARTYLAHRIVWTLAKGNVPSGQIDHINGVRDDNRLVNLRDVSVLANRHNVRIGKRNKTGVLGVQPAHGGKWQASICVEYKSIHLGTFATIGEAAAARKSAERRYGFHPNHGTAV